jgi:pSer/pThr/pTyr-binding forkhead associated (FHA) protein
MVSLTDRLVPTKQQVKCPECAAQIEVSVNLRPNEIVHCYKCGRDSAYKPIQLVPELVFERNNKQIIFPLTYDVTVGRECNDDYITLRSEIDQTVKQDTYIRNKCVTKQPHAKIKLNEELISYKDGTRLLKQKCSVEDASTTHGTAVNDKMLTPNEKRELKNGDIITLAPNSTMKLVIIFRESIRNC